MNLKEAFRFQNKLQSLIDEVQRVLEDESNITEVKITEQAVLRDPQSEKRSGYRPRQRGQSQYHTPKPRPHPQAHERSSQL